MVSNELVQVETVPLQQREVVFRARLSSVAKRKGGGSGAGGFDSVTILTRSISSFPGVKWSSGPLTSHPSNKSSTSVERYLPHVCSSTRSASLILSAFRSLDLASALESLPAAGRLLGVSGRVSSVVVASLLFVHRERRGASTSGACVPLFASTSPLLFLGSRSLLCLGNVWWLRREELSIRSCRRRPDR